MDCYGVRALAHERRQFHNCILNLYFEIGTDPKTIVSKEFAGLDTQVESPPIQKVDYDTNP